MKKDALLNSQPVSRAFFCIVRGENYAALIQKSMRVEPPSVFRYISVLKKNGLITTVSMGRIVRYLPNWKNVAELWRETIASALKEEYADWKTGGDRKADSLANEAFEAMMVNGRSKLAKVEDKWLTEFTEKYLTVLAKTNFTFTIADAFLWFYSYVFYPRTEQYRIRDKEVLEYLKALQLHPFDFLFHKEETEIRGYLLKTTKKMDE